MNLADEIGALFIGLLGSAHCIGMCGGIASALGIGNVTSNHPILNALFYNAGRLLSYMLAGALVGGAVAGAADIASQGFILNWLRVVSGVIMLVLALYIGRWWQGLLITEKAGYYLWRYIAPLTQKLLPLRSPVHALPLGFLWGWLPCGLVYSTLTWAAVSGSGVNGALIMLAFGMGTLPSMLLFGVGVTWLKKIKKSVIFRQTGAVLLMSYGIYTIITTVRFL